MASTQKNIHRAAFEESIGAHDLRHALHGFSDLTRTLHGTVGTQTRVYSLSLCSRADLKVLSLLS